MRLIIPLFLLGLAAGDAEAATVSSTAFAALDQTRSFASALAAGDASVAQTRVDALGSLDQTLRFSLAPGAGSVLGGLRWAVSDAARLVGVHASTFSTRTATW